MENRLLVFVSSLMGELLHERQVVKEAVGAIPLTRPWIFEHTPASTACLTESYLRKVRECDIFILLVGRDISEPIREEYHTAVDHSKPRLVFLKDVERSLEADAFVRNIDVKWAKFASNKELRKAVQEALIDELIRGYKTYRLQPDELGELGQMAQSLVEGQISTAERSVAVGGNVTDSTIITGDHNVVQRGKYNVSIGEAKGIAIGDEAGVDTSGEGEEEGKEQGLPGHDQ